MDFQDDWEDENESGDEEWDEEDESDDDEFPA